MVSLFKSMADTADVLVDVSVKAEAATSLQRVQDLRVSSECRGTVCRMAGLDRHRQARMCCRPARVSNLISFDRQAADPDPSRFDDDDTAREQRRVDAREDAEEVRDLPGRSFVGSLSEQDD